MPCLTKALLLHPWQLRLPRLAPLRRARARAPHPARRRPPHARPRRAHPWRHHRPPRLQRRPVPRRPPRRLPRRILHPLFKWRFLSFRAIAFYDAGYTTFQSRRPTDRDYLPNQLTASYSRTNLGTGLRIYLDNIVLPLLGFDLAYGIEGHSPEIYFEVGLTDF